MTYTFIAYNSNGLRISGSKGFSKKSELEEYMVKSSLTNYKYFTSRTRYKSKNYKNVSPKELSVFCSQISVLFFSQITFMEGVLLLSEQSENKELSLALKEIYSHMGNGYTFAESMGMYEHIFGSYLLNMVHIGEASGTLDEVFKTMHGYFEKEDKTRKKIKSAITYPAILSVLMASIILLLVLKILPMFQETLAKMGHDIPTVTRFIFNTSNFITNYLVFFVIAIALIIIAFFIYKRTDRGRFKTDKLKLSLPIMKYIYSRILTARLSKSLAILLKSGVQIINALEESTQLLNNSYVEQQFSKSISSVKSGEDLPEALKEMELFPPLFLRIVAIGLKTGYLDEMLNRASDVFETEVDESLERFSIMIEPLLIIILSVVVGIILISVMLPMISIMNNIG